tara:strand:+ start:2834 stop:4354 length:1521 start_codon:yes stop_codon:yes gene_type:complete
MIKKLYFIPIILILTSCSIFKQKAPQPEREFRGFWVATVVNIDWPKNSSDSIEKQKADYLKIIDFYDTLNFNAAIVQIRTAGDAFYTSDYAPWSEYLTGKEGIAPKNNENLLEWMISETHKRGMEFHAWLNPYRATFDLDTLALSEKHDYYLHPDWMLKYGKKYYYNPGIPEVQEHLVSIIGEVVANYDIDAIHFDDYFYPYKIKDEVFQDSVTFSQFSLPKQSLDDWRRSNVDSLIQNTHQKIKQEKPWVQFGVSPFGVWKNKSTDARGSDTQAGQTTYEDLYADPLLWMQNKWIDYIIPQAYWSIDLSVASHKTILEWWAQNSNNTNLYIGNGPYKIRNNSDTAWNKKKELPNQISLGRGNAIVQGNAFFSAKSLMRNNDDVVKILKRKYYKQIALPPISPISTHNKPINPSLKSQRINNTNTVLKFNSLDDFRYALVFKVKNPNKPDISFKKLMTRKIPISENEVGITKDELKKNKNIAIIFIDKFGVKTNPIFINLEQTKHE